MRFKNLFTILVRTEYLAGTNNLPKRYGAGPLRRGAQCSRIGWIDLRPALPWGIKMESTFIVKKSKLH